MRTRTWINWLTEHLIDKNMMANNNYPKKFYKIELVNKSFNFLKKIVRKTCKISKIIYSNGIIRKITLAIYTIIFGLSVMFGNFETIKKNPTFNEPNRPNQVEIHHISGGDLGKASNPGVRARNDFKKFNATKSNPEKSSFTNAWTSTWQGSRPEAANNLGK